MEELAFHQRVPMRDFEGSFALISRAPERSTAIVFVHGLNGSPDETWAQFHILIDLYADLFPEFKKSDFYFFAYDSMKLAVPFCAGQLLEFLRTVFPNPGRDVLKAPSGALVQTFQQELNAALATMLNVSYHRLVLVGHSLGALLLRIAIWSAYSSAYVSLPLSADQSAATLVPALIAEDPLLRAEVVLFAPALYRVGVFGRLGLVSIILQQIPWVGKPLLSALGMAVPAISTLEGEDDILKDTKEYIEDEVSKGRKVSALMARVMWGAEEQYLSMWQYRWDTPVEFEPNLDHLQVCKPTPNFLGPLEFVYGTKAGTTAR